MTDTRYGVYHGAEQCCHWHQPRPRPAVDRCPPPQLGLGPRFINKHRTARRFFSRSMDESDKLAINYLLHNNCCISQTMNNLSAPYHIPQ